MINQPLLSCAHALGLAEHELMLFALVWYLIGMIDEGAIDLLFVWMRLSGRIATPRFTDADMGAPPAICGAGGAQAVWPGLTGTMAVFVPAWREAAVIGPTVAHMLSVWRDPGLTLYVGCYCNDPGTIAAAMAAAADARVRIVVNARPGPTTKADCLNRLYRAMVTDEARRGSRFRGVVLHDAEDMVHPLALAVIDRGLGSADLVQIPVRPELPAGAHGRRSIGPEANGPELNRPRLKWPKMNWPKWNMVAGHYADEFTESHAKGLVVRGALGAAVPAAGVGCGIGRAMLARIAVYRGGLDAALRPGDDVAWRRAAGAAEAAAAPTAMGLWADAAVAPFAYESLTEDYETGMLVARLGGRTRFVRLRDGEGRLIATRSYFPDTLITAVRQKARWIHGIALQAWDRLGWHHHPIEVWMFLRDRKGPLAAVVLAAGYLLLAVEMLLLAMRAIGVGAPRIASPVLLTVMQVCLAGAVWRMMMRALFVGREYGWGEGVRAIVRIPVANVITIMAAQRGLAAYCGTLRGARVTWDKTTHDRHPVLAKVAPDLSPDLSNLRATGTVRSADRAGAEAGGGIAAA